MRLISSAWLSKSFYPRLLQIELMGELGTGFLPSPPLRCWRRPRRFGNRVTKAHTSKKYLESISQGIPLLHRVKADLRQIEQDEEQGISHSRPYSFEIQPPQLVVEPAAEHSQQQGQRHGGDTKACNIRPAKRPIGQLREKAGRR